MAGMTLDKRVVTSGYHFNDTLPLLFGQSIYGLPPLLKCLERGSQFGTNSSQTSSVPTNTPGSEPEQMIIAVSEFSSSFGPPYLDMRLPQTIGKLSIDKTRKPRRPRHRLNLHHVALGRLGLENKVEAWW